MKKFSLIAAGMAAFLSFNVSAFNLLPRTNADDVRDIIQNSLVDKEAWIQNKELSVKDKALALQTYVIYGKNSNINAAEELMIDILQDSGTYAGPWKSRSSGIGSTVMANDELISLQRVLYGAVKFKEIPVVYTVQDDQSSETREITGNAMSRTLMRSGRAPVGPDGAQIRLCRLFNDTDATFYEVSNLQSIDIINRSESNMSVDEACITYEPLLNKYWKKRLVELIDKEGVELR